MKHYLMLFVVLLVLGCNEKSPKKETINSNVRIPFSEPELRKILASQIVSLVSHTYKYGEPDTFNARNGLIINENFILTCYHGADFKNGRRIKSIKVFRLKEESGLDTFDVDLNYKYISPQYDFSNHKFYDSNRVTDIIIYKLKKGISFTPVKFATEVPDFTEPIYSLGFLERTPGKMDLIPEGVLSSFIGIYIDGKDSNYLTTIGTMRRGYSGTAIYNKYGEVAGIVLSGLEKNETIDFIKRFNEGRSIDRKINTDSIKGRQVCFSLDIQYIRNKYLNGFLNKNGFNQ